MGLKERQSAAVVHGVDPSDTDGLRRLAKASLLKAIDDARGRDLQPAYSAVRWLAGNTSDGLTFLRCCELIGIAPNAVRRSLCRRYEAIRVRLDKYIETNSMFVAKSYCRPLAQRGPSA